MRYRAQAPLRIDFGGGWTDVPEYAESEPGGGAVLNAAINVYAQGWIERPYSSLVPQLAPANTPSEREAGAAGHLHVEGPASTPGSGFLGRLIKRAKSASANTVHYQLEAPAGAGLGGSAAQTLLWLTLVKSSIANTSSRRELAERAWHVEKQLGILGGRQDHYCSAVGGVNFMTFGSKTEVESLKLPLSLIDELEPRLALFYTGQSHLSGDIHEAVWSRYRGGDAVVVNALRDLRRIAGEQRDALLSGDLDRLGRLINDNWAAQKRLHPSVTNGRLDRLASVAWDHGAIGVKATGAGGGGSILCLREAGATGLVDAMRDAGAVPIPFRFDWFGVHLTKG